MEKIILGLKNSWIALAFLVMGILLVIFPEQAMVAAPYMLGLGLIIKSAIGVIALIKYKNDTKVKAGDIVVDAVLGSAILYQNATAIGPIGAIWAMASLKEVAEEITEAFENKEFSLLRMIFAIASIALAIMLIFNPFEHFAFHIRILGLEMISGFFTRLRKKESERKQK